MICFFRKKIKRCTSIPVCMLDKHCLFWLILILVSPFTENEGTVFYWEWFCFVFVLRVILFWQRSRPLVDFIDQTIPILSLMHARKEGMTSLFYNTSFFQRWILNLRSKKTTGVFFFSREAGPMRMWLHGWKVLYIHRLVVSAGIFLFVCKSSEMLPKLSTNHWLEERNSSHVFLLIVPIYPFEGVWSWPKLILPCIPLPGREKNEERGR